jgi:DNA anti-recombination protein RmuC
MSDNNQKSMTIDDLAVMVAKGFEGVDGRMDKLDHQMQALNSNVNNYLELSEKRYSELKQRDALLAKWLKLVADKSGVPIDVSQLEKI